MNFSQYIVVVFVAQTVRCNVINGRISTFDDTSKRTENEETDIGVNLNGNNRDFSSKESGLITYSDVSQHPSNNKMTSSDFLHMIMSSETPSSSIIRIKRKAGGRSPKRRKCDPDDASCKPKSRRGKKRKNRNKKNKKERKNNKCKRKKGGKRKKGCTKRKKNPALPPRTPKPPAINSSNHSRMLVTPRTVVKECVRTLLCPKGTCCARRHHNRMCMPYLGLGEICTKPTQKSRRNADYYERCGCESHLVCRRESNQGKLYTCQAKT